jgi:hypothetical protein
MNSVAYKGNPSSLLKAQQIRMWQASALSQFIKFYDSKFVKASNFEGS